MKITRYPCDVNKTEVREFSLQMQVEIKTFDWGTIRVTVRDDSITTFTYSDFRFRCNINNTSYLTVLIPKSQTQKNFGI